MRASAIPAEEAPPDAGALPGAPHPREAPRLIGHRGAVAEVEAALAAGRVHHAWLLAGPRGIGKATLAWRMAAALRAGAASLDLPPDHPVRARMAAGAEPGTLSIRRAWDAKAGRHRAQIGVEEVRALGAFFALSLTGGGRRVAIVDAADEMTVPAQNALLKSLEEPPAGAVLLLVAHRPEALLPTIRSRCRTLRLGPLAPAEIAEVLRDAGAEADPASTALARGSAGEALRLSAAEVGAAYAAILRLLSQAPGMDRRAILALTEPLSGRGGPERADALVSMIEAALARLAATGAAGAPPAPEAVPGEGAILARLAPTPAAARAWADLHAALAPRAREGLAVNLDPAALCTDTLIAIDRRAATLPSR